MLSEKYGRTYHYPFSPGTTSDDRINHTQIRSLCPFACRTYHFAMDKPVASTLGVAEKRSGRY